MEQPVTKMGPERTQEIRDRIVEAIRTIYDPEIPVNIYELGLIYDLQVSPFGDAYVKMTLTSPNCPVAGSLPGEVEDKVKTVEGVKSVDLELTFDPAWDQSMMTEEARLELGFM